MKIGIIVEGNEVIGLGHVIRCKNIAKYLKSRLVEVTFILPYSFDQSLIEDFNSILIPTDKWLNIKTNHEYFKKILKNFDSILIDLVEHKYCEFSFLERLQVFIASLTLFEFKKENYFGNVSFFPSITKFHYKKDKTEIFSGPQYFIIDDKIKKLKRDSRNKKPVPMILISMGGSDPVNITTKVIESTDNFTFKFNAIVIAGKANRNKEHIRLLTANRSNLKYYEFVNDIENIYSQIDFAIINGGNTRYELTFLQIPYACISIHEIQNNINKNVTNLYGGLNLGIYNKSSVEYIAKEIQRTISTPQKLNAIKQKMEKFNGGNGQYIIGNTLIHKKTTYEEND